MQTELVTTLECGCCGNDAIYREDGLFTDGDELECGCPGWVSVDGEEDPWVNNGDEPCSRCDPGGEVDQ